MLRAAAALSQEHIWALASLPVVSSTSQSQSSPSKIWVDCDLDSEVHPLYLFQRAYRIEVMLDVVQFVDIEMLTDF